MLVEWLEEGDWAQVLDEFMHMHVYMCHHEFHVCSLMLVFRANFMQASYVFDVGPHVPSLGAQAGRPKIPITFMACCHVMSVYSFCIG